MNGEPENTALSDGDCSGDENSGVDHAVGGCGVQNLTISGGDDDKKEILKFTMLINKVNSDMDVKRNWRAKEESTRYKRDVKCAMFFNKEVTIRSNSEIPSPAPPPFLTIKSLEPNEVVESGSKQTSFIKANPFRALVQKLDSVPKQAEKPSSDASFFSAAYPNSDVPAKKNKNHKTSESSNLKKVSSKRNVKSENDLGRGPSPDLRIHYSLTSLSKNIKVGLRGVLKSKIPSLTAIETSCATTKAGGHKYGCWERWNSTTALGAGNEDLVEKRFNLQISKSSNDNNRRSLVKLRKEEPASVSDSKLLNTDSNCKKPIKKYDKKSRGDSMKKEKDGRGNGSIGRKHVQWKTEVDVIYFSTHLAANGDRTGEVVGRVMEPLREEWEQQRKGFYSKFVPYHMESHLKDHFISLLKI